jgi:hypothetical protein
MREALCLLIVSFDREAIMKPWISVIGACEKCSKISFSRNTVAQCTVCLAKDIASDIVTTDISERKSTIAAHSCSREDVGIVARVVCSTPRTWAEKDMALGDQTRQRVLLVLKSATPAPLFPLYTGASKATKMYNSILDQGCLQREPRAYRSESFPLTKGTVYLFELEGQIV